MPRLNRDLHTFIFGIFALIGLSYLFPLAHLFEVDFIQYYTAHSLVQLGSDPYNPTLLRAAQLTLRPDIQFPIMMWNPPWLLAIFRPILLLPYHIAIVVWITVSLLAYATSWWISCKFLLKKELDHYASVASHPFSSIALLYLPAVVCLAFGQLSHFLLLGAILFILGLKKSSPIFIGCGMILMSLKPHLFFLIGLAVLNHLIRREHVRPALYGTAIALTFLLGVIFTNPILFMQWMEAISDPLPGAVPPKAWIVSTLAGATRFYISQLGLAGGNLWPSVVLPLVSLFGLQLYITFSRERFSLLRDWHWILALSYLFSPYGWVFDAVLLLPLFMTLCAPTTDSNNRTMSQVIAIVAIALQVVCYSLLFVPGLKLAQHSFWWMPTAIFALWLFREKYISLHNRATGLSLDRANTTNT